MAKILSEVSTNIANEKIKQENGFGISIINLPEIDFEYFINNLKDITNIEIYFLGYGDAKKEEFKKYLTGQKKITLHFTVLPTSFSAKMRKTMPASMSSVSAAQRC